MKLKHILNYLFKESKKLKQGKEFYEFCLWIKFMSFYIRRKNKFYKNDYKKGEIIYAELGSNIGNELSYIHPCVVLENKIDNIFIIPCSSSKVSKIYNKNGKIYEEYILAKQIDGFNKDTILLLNNVRWISKTRVVNKMGKISKPLLEKLYIASFRYSYSSQFFQLKKVEEKNEKLSAQLFKLQKEIKVLNEKIDK